jgi:hypothetical protein
MKFMPMLLGVVVSSALFSGPASDVVAEDNRAPQSAGTIAQETHRAQARPLPEPRFLAARWSNGFWVSIVAHEYDSTAADTANVFLADADGVRVRDARVWVSGSTLVHIDDAVVADAAGTLLVAGYAVTSDRGTVHFIARLNPSGALGAMIDTGPFVVECVRPAPDGTVWALGQELDKARLHEDDMMLRQYAFGSGLLGKYLSRDSFHCRVSPAVVAECARTAGGFGQASYVRCDGSRVVVYVNLTNELVELDTTTHAVQRFAVKMSGRTGDTVKGFAFTDDGRIYAGLSGGSGANPVGTNGLYELSADSATHEAHWIPVEGTVTTLDEAGHSSQGTFVRLWGAEGSNLIIERANAGLSSVRLWPASSAAQ